MAVGVALCATTFDQQVGVIARLGPAKKEPGGSDRSHQLREEQVKQQAATAEKARDGDP